MKYTYIQAISLGFPGVQCHSLGEGDVYEDLVWDAGLPLPSKEALDTWIENNPILEDRKITVLAFRARFTLQEKVAIELASIDNPNAPMQERLFAASVRVYLKDLDSAKYIDLGDERTSAGLEVQEQYGLIAVGRGSEILNTPISAKERPDYIG